MSRVVDRFINSRLQDAPQLWTDGGWSKRFGMAPDPDEFGISWTSAQVEQWQAPSRDVLMGYYAAANAAAVEYIQGLDDADLERVITTPNPPAPSRCPRPWGFWCGTTLSTAGRWPTCGATTKGWAGSGRKAVGSSWKTTYPGVSRRDDVILPSFRRKPESTHPRRCPPPCPGGNPTNPKNHPNQTNHSSRQGPPLSLPSLRLKAGLASGDPVAGAWRLRNARCTLRRWVRATVSPIRSTGRSSAF